MKLETFEIPLNPRHLLRTAGTSVHAVVAPLSKGDFNPPF